jgi:hypothetical protein
MSGIRCLFGFHELGGIVARSNRLSVRCTRCDRLSPGVVIDGPPPIPLRVEPPKSRIWWLRAVYVKQGA